MVWGNSVAPNGMETGFPQKGSAFCGMSAHVGADAHIGLRGGEKNAQENTPAPVRGLPGDEAQEGAHPGGQEPGGRGLPGFQGEEAGPRGLCLPRCGVPEGRPQGQARKSRALERAFSAAMPDGVYDALEAQMREGGDG